MFLSHGFWVFLTLEFFLSPTSDPSLQLLPPVLEDIGCFRGKNALESPLSSGIGLRGMASLWHFPAPGCARILPRWSWCGGGKEGIPFGSQPLLGLVPECALGAHRQAGYHHLPACAPHLPQDSVDVAAAVVLSVPTTSAQPAATICGTEGKLEASHHFLLPSWLQCCCSGCPFH